MSFKKDFDFADFDHCEELEDAFNEKFGSGFAASWHGNTKDTNKIVLDVETGRTKIIIGISKFATGVDIPEASVCFNVAPTESPVRATQRGGRVLRLCDKNPNKLATIIDFVYIDNRKNRQVLYPSIIDRSKVFQKKKSRGVLANPSISRKIDNAKEEDLGYDDFPMKGIAGLTFTVQQEEIMRIVRKIEASISFDDVKSIVNENGIKSISEYNSQYRRLGIPYFTNIRSMDGFTTAYDFFRPHGVLDIIKLRGLAIHTS